MSKSSSAFNSSNHSLTGTKLLAITEWLMFLSAVVLIYYIVIVHVGAIDGINDDWGVYNVLTGSYLGYPDAHCSFMEYTLSWPIAKLYQFAPGIHWYGVFMEGCIAICAISFFIRFHFRIKAPSLRIIAEITVFLFWASLSIGLLTRMQYTLSSGALAAASLFWLLTVKDNSSLKMSLRDSLPGVLLALLAEAIRPEVLYLYLICLFPSWVCKWALHKDRFSSRRIMQFIIIPLFAFLLLGAQLVCSSFAYRSQEWRDFRKIDRYRVQLADYTGYPSYEDNLSKFEAADITKEDYDLISALWLYQGRYLSVKQWQTIVDISVDTYNRENSILDRLSILPEKIKEIHNAPVLRMFRRPVYFMSGIVLLLIFIAGYSSLNILLPMLISFITGDLLCYTILCYRGRVLDRIQIIFFWVFMAQILCLLLMLFEKKEDITINHIKYTFFYGLLFLLISLRLSYYLISNVNYYKDLTVSEVSQEITWNAFKDYCHTHPDHFYIVLAGSDTIRYYYDRAFDPSLSIYENYIYPGSGFSMGPNATIKLAALGISDLTSQCVDNKKIGFIYCNSAETSFLTCRTYQLLQDRFSDDVTTLSAEVVDTFKAGNTSYNVYQLNTSTE